MVSNTTYNIADIIHSLNQPFLSLLTMAARKTSSSSVQSLQKLALNTLQKYAEVKQSSNKLEDVWNSLPDEANKLLVQIEFGVKETQEEADNKIESIKKSVEEAEQDRDIKLALFKEDVNKAKINKDFELLSIGRNFRERLAQLNSELKTDKLSAITKVVDELDNLVLVDKEEYEDLKSTGVLLIEVNDSVSTLQKQLETKTSELNKVKFENEKMVISKDAEIKSLEIQLKMMKERVDMVEISLNDERSKLVDLANAMNNPSNVSINNESRK